MMTCFDLDNRHIKLEQDELDWLNEHQIRCKECGHLLIFHIESGNCLICFTKSFSKIIQGRET